MSSLEPPHWGLFYLQTLLQIGQCGTQRASPAIRNPNPLTAGGVGHACAYNMYAPTTIVPKASNAWSVFFFITVHHYSYNRISTISLQKELFHTQATSGASAHCFSN